MGSTQGLRFSFLTSGPFFTVQVPTDVRPIPELQSPVLSGVGGRTFSFTPDPDAQALVAGMDAEGTYVSTLTGRDGRDITVQQRAAPPLTWWLRWLVAGGVITTHLREADGLERADVLADSVTVIETTSTPTLLLDLPLKRAVDAFPGYQEFAQTWTADQSISVTFTRPGFIGPGRLATTTLGDLTMIRAGLDSGIEAQAMAPDPAVAREIVSTILESFGEESSV